MKTTPPRRRPRTSRSSTPRSRTSRRRSRTGSVGVIRGYLANAEKVRVRGAEFDGNARHRHALLAPRRARLHRRQVRLVPRRAAAARGHRRSRSSKDISGQPLPGISKWGASLGGEVTFPLHAFGGGQIFGGLDYHYRSAFSSSPTPSQYLWVDGYSHRQRARRLPRVEVVGLPLGAKLDRRELHRAAARRGRQRGSVRGRARRPENVRCHRPLLVRIGLCSAAAPGTVPRHFSFRWTLFRSNGYVGNQRSCASRADRNVTCT